MHTIMGASGFLGSNLKVYIENLGEDIFLAPRDVYSIPKDKELGNVFYCIGLTADYRDKPFETIEAHVSCLSYVLKNLKFSSLLYLSTTRLYQNSLTGKEEEDISVNSSCAEDIYNISKLLGESLCRNLNNKNIKIARLSNIFGPGMCHENFLYEISIQALRENKICLRTAVNSSKDYLDVKDAVPVLYKIATGGKEFLYNVASGENTKTLDIINTISQACDLTIKVSENAPTITASAVDIHKIQNEFSFCCETFEKSYINFLKEIQF
jgi:nucleoside-diphosphate-sugar epimerase